MPFAIIVNMPVKATAAKTNTLCGDKSSHCWFTGWNWARTVEINYKPIKTIAIQPELPRSVITSQTSRVSDNKPAHPAEKSLL